ncbi:AraC family transcriptional regulator [Paenibacillus mesotrionivorans]|uniref:AraC family transcriptional regulator n=1 Tax=Paenibacillus mesotrionivorans TaxID=3160968 RepID=A0ACC7NVQ1_9BACL
MIQVELNRLYLHIYFILRRTTEGGWSGSRKHLSGHTLYWIHEGEGTFIAGEKREVTAGSLLYARPDMEVQYRSSERRPLDFTIIRFECMTVEPKEDSWSTSPVVHLPLPFCMPAANVDRLEASRLMERIIRGWNPSAAGGEVASKAALSEMLLYAEKHLSGRKQESRFTLFERIKEAIQLRHTSSLSVEELARTYGISPVYLRKLFHEYEGCSPKQYLETVRHENALRLLLHSDLSLRMIAEVCGYTDEFHFSKVFKKRTGQSPARYKRMSV